MTFLGLLFALIAAALPGAAGAQTGWQAEYWNNTSLSGAPVVTRREAAIDHNWGTGSPATDLLRDNFSARWTQTITLDEGEYRFTVSADDGVRVWLNGMRIIDSWRRAGLRTLSAHVYLATGQYEMAVEYFEANGVARIDFARARAGSPRALPAEPTPTTAADDEPVSPAGVWRAEYYDNLDLSGTPALVRSENNIDFRWGTGSPAPNLIAPDTFSARWEGTLDLAPGRYRFAVTADDGVRLYLNDRLVIDQWHEQSATTYTADIEVGAAPLDVRMDYFENLDRATARFSYARILSTPTPAPPPSGDGAASWRGQYYDNVNLSGPPVFTEIDPAIDFDWRSSSPAPEQLGTDRFSVRWSATLDLAPGRYRFTATADDGVRLYIDGERVIDEFVVQSAQTYSVERAIADGQADVVMEYFENTGQAVAKLTWTQVD